MDTVNSTILEFREIAIFPYYNHITKCYKENRKTEEKYLLNSDEENNKKFQKRKLL